MVEAYDPWAVPPDPWAAVAEKRDAAIVIKDEASAIKMNYVSKVPTRYHATVILPNRHQTYTAEEMARRSELAAKRDDVISFREEAKALFKKADKDGSGQLDMEEVINIRNSEDKAELTMKVNDADDSGTLNIDEFVSMLMRTYYKSPAAARRIMMVYAKSVDDSILRKRGEGTRRNMLMD